MTNQKGLPLRLIEFQTVVAVRVVVGKNGLGRSKFVDIGMHSEKSFIFVEETTVEMVMFLKKISDLSYHFKLLV